MSRKYLLPCSCGEMLPVEISQAGQQISCQCGRKVEAPTMRGIRNLQAAETPERHEATSQHRSWGAARGALFAAGLLIAAIALIISSVLAYRRAQLDTADWMPDRGALLDARIDLLPADECWILWKSVTARGLGRQTPPEHVLAGRAHAALSRGLYAALTAALTGGLLAAGALLLRRPRRPSANR